jgi:hypothetical protein
MFADGCRLHDRVTLEIGRSYNLGDPATGKLLAFGT